MANPVFLRRRNPLDILKYQTFFSKSIRITRMHSSRMLTGRSLTVLGGVSAPAVGGVCSLGVSAVGGCLLLLLGGVCSCSWWGGVCSWGERGCLLLGSVCSWGVSAPALFGGGGVSAPALGVVYPSMH